MLTAYVLSVIACLKSSISAKKIGFKKQSSYWSYLSGIVFFLGLNKFLFLHGCAAYGIRYLAMKNGWYDLRREPQMVFIFIVVVIFVGIIFYLYNLVKYQTKTIVCSMIIVVLLLLLVIIRVASLHQVDTILYSTLTMGTGLNAFLELFGTVGIGILAYLNMIKQTRSKQMQ